VAGCKRGPAVRAGVLVRRGDQRHAVGAVVAEHHRQPRHEHAEAEGETGDEDGDLHGSVSAGKGARCWPALVGGGWAGAAPETRHGVELTNLDAVLFPDAGATKRDLVDYLDAISDRLVPVLANRPLSVIRVMRGQDSFMQKNVPKYTPDWVETVTWWAESS